MEEIEELIRSLNQLTDQKIADANQGKVVNKWRKHYVIGLMILMYIIFLLAQFTAHSFLEKVGYVILVLILGGIGFFLVWKDESISSIYFTNQFGERKSFYDYRLEMVYLYFLIKGYISANHSNRFFYDYVLNITTEVKKESILSPKKTFGLVYKILSVFALFTPFIDSAWGLQWFIYVLGAIIVIFSIVVYIYSRIYQKNKSYFLLHSILTDLRIKDCIKFNGNNHYSAGGLYVNCESRFQRT